MQSRFASKFLGSYRAVVLILYMGVAFLVIPYGARPFLERWESPIADFYRELLPGFTTGGAVLIGAGIVLLFARYLGVFDDLSVDASSSREVMGELSSISDRLAELSSKIGTQEVALPNDVSSRLLEIIGKKAKRALSTALVRETFEQYSKNIYDAKSLEAIETQFDTVIRDLKMQLHGWGRNANTNLILGIIFALGGMMLMYFSLVSSIQISLGEKQNEFSMLYFFLSRTGLVIIIESIAFFFLKLYREDRTMIRYLRNEVTNVEMRFMSLRSSILFSDKETLSRILIGLAATERNFVLRKEERVITDVTHENNEIMLEKIVSRLLPDLPSKAAPATKAD